MPYVTDKFTAYQGDVITTNLSFAVWLIDEYTEKRSLGHMRVIIKGENIKGISNINGYYIFTNLDTGTYEIEIVSDFYFTGEETINMATLAPKNPVVEVTLRPRPAYPFPDNSTLVRGLVSNADPIIGAEVGVTGKTIKTITDEKGEFVIYFKGIKTEDITIEIKKDTNTKNVPAVTIKEGETTNTGIISFP